MRRLVITQGGLHLETLAHAADGRSVGVQTHGTVRYCNDAHRKTKSFLVLFFKKEPLPRLLSTKRTDHV
jgi:hypothetical protein